MNRKETQRCLLKEEDDRSFECVRLYPKSMLLRGSLLIAFTLDSSPLMLLNVILSNRMEHQIEDALSEENKTTEQWGGEEKMVQKIKSHK